MFHDLNKLVKIVELEHYNIGCHTLKQWLSVSIARRTASMHRLERDIVLPIPSVSP